MKEEHELNKELQLMERRVEDWGKPLNARIFKPIVNSLYRTQSQEEDDPAGEFQKFVSSSGGHCGGWEEQDHLLFLRERRKCNGKPKFMSVVHCLLPGNFIILFFTPGLFLRISRWKFKEMEFLETPNGDFFF